MTARRRVLVAGISTPAGAGLARRLERDPAVAAVVGVDEASPALELHRTEFVRAGAEVGPLIRILRAAEIDTVVDARVRADADAASARVDLPATEALLAAAVEAASVSRVVLASSTDVYGCGGGDPAYFTEEMAPGGRGDGELQRALLSVERAALDLRAHERGIDVSILRLVAPVGAGTDGAWAGLLSLPGVVPGVLGFDPRCQFIAPDDAEEALAHVVLVAPAGVYNAAADGVLVLSEVASLLDRRVAPVLPPFGAGLAAAGLRRAGLRLAPETVALLRHGRAVDNRRLKATGFRFRHTTREVIVRLREAQRVAPLLPPPAPYEYDEELEQFLRRSPAAGARTRQDAPA